MKICKASFIFVSFLFFAFTVNNARAAMVSYMSLEGDNQGPIEGSVYAEGKEGTIAVYSLGHNLFVPYDQATGAPSDRRAHTPLRILKETDKSSPKLYQALATGERLNPVTIKFYHINRFGVEEQYYTIELRDAYIISITPSYPTTFVPDNEPYRHMESVGFVYGKIKWTHEIDAVQWEDSWN